MATSSHQRPNSGKECESTSETKCGAGALSSTNCLQIWLFTHHVTISKDFIVMLRDFYRNNIADTSAIKQVTRYSAKAMYMILEIRLVSKDRPMQSIQDWSVQSLAKSTISSASRIVFGQAGSSGKRKVEPDSAAHTDSRLLKKT